MAQAFGASSSASGHAHCRNASSALATKPSRRIRYRHADGDQHLARDVIGVMRAVHHLLVMALDRVAARGAGAPATTACQANSSKKRGSFGINALNQLNTTASQRKPLPRYHQKPAAPGYARRNGSHCSEHFPEKSLPRT